MYTQIKIINTVVTPQYGSLSNGDVLRTTPAFAKHLVEICKAAKYVEAPVDISEPVVIVVRKSKKGNKK